MSRNDPQEQHGEQEAAHRELRQSIALSNELIAQSEKLLSAQRAPPQALPERRPEG